MSIGIFVECRTRSVTLPIMRRSLSNPREKAYYFVFAPPGTTLQEMVEAIGARWHIEIVQPQMTKTKMLTGRGGGDHIADLHLLVGALPHMESDFAFFTKHPLCKSCLRFQPTYQFPNFPSPKRPKAPRMR